jgi:glutaredoxin
MTAPTEVTLLTKNPCTYCDHAKQVLHRVGRDYPLRITEIALDTDMGQVLARRAGVMFAPGVLLDGEAFSYGRLSERKLRRTLRTRVASSS